MQTIYLVHNMLHVSYGGESYDQLIEALITYTHFYKSLGSDEEQYHILIKPEDLAHFQALGCDINWIAQMATESLKNAPDRRGAISTVLYDGRSFFKMDGVPLVTVLPGDYQIEWDKKVKRHGIYQKIDSLKKELHEL